MAQPTTYDRQYNFEDFQAGAPTTPLPGDQVDLELNSVKVTLDEILANLELIQRDDGELGNETVGLDQLKPEVEIGFNPPTTWATATNYAVRDYVFKDSVLYRCLVAHTSGTFATDLAAAKWVEVAEFLSTNLLAVAELDMAADQSWYFTGATTAAAYALTAQGRALAGLAATGIPAITGASSATTRTITGTANEITVTNGNGVSGNPTLSFPSSISMAGKTIDQGTYTDPILSGSPTAPTASNSVTNTQIATTAHVKSVRLDQFAVPTASVAFNSQRITGLSDPSSAQDAATKNYVDSTVQGLDPKASVACATTANITLSGEQTIDGVLTSASRVLVKNQSTGAENGIYVSAAGAWSRATDMDHWDEVPQAFTFVTAGTVNASTGWVCTNAAGGTLDTTAITWSQFSGAGTYTAGDNITLTGTVFSVSVSPTFVTPNIGVATATSVNKVTITAPATGSTLTIADGKTLTVSNTMTLVGTDARTYTFPSASGAVVTADSTNTLTNKTFDTAGTGNSFSINGVAATANTGTGSVVRATSPTLVTPTLGVATATSINGLTITSSTGTVTIANSKTLTVSNTLTFTGTDGTSFAFPSGSGTVVTADSTATLTNKTLTSPDINGGTADSLTSLSVRTTGSAHDVTLAVTEVLTAGRTLTLKLNDAARTIDLGGSLTLASSLTTSGAHALIFTVTGATNVTLPTTGTLSTLAGVETLLNKTLTSPVMTTPTLGVATATSINGLTITSSTGTLTIASGKTLTASNTLTFTGTDGTSFAFPGANDTVAGLAAVQSITGAKTFADATLKLAGATSGASTLKAPAIASTYVHTLPAATTTLLGTDNTATLTNKTFDTAGSGNSFSINGTAITAVTGTGAVVLDASPALTGNPTAPTQTAGNNSTRLATTAFVQAAIVASGGGDMLSTENLADVADVTTARNNISAVLSGHLYGLTLSNNGGDAVNDIDIATGEAADSTAVQLIRLTSALTKRLDAGWAAGTGNGMRNSGAAITNTTYHIYLVSKAAGADPDIYAHTSTTVSTVITALQAESGGGSYIYARRIGSILRVSASIVAFLQTGDMFQRAVPNSDAFTPNPGTSAVVQALSIPTGLKLEPMISVATKNGTNNINVLISDPDIADIAASGSNYTITNWSDSAANWQTMPVKVMTNTSAAIRYRFDVSGADDSIQIITRGWIDRRGRDG